MITTIYKGYRITAHGKEWEVIGSRSLRGNYRYILIDANGKQASIKRSEVIKGQELGTITVTGPSDQWRKQAAEDATTLFVLRHGHTGTL